ncbi:MAG: TonB-dependent receptor [Acidobacteria bacterium]|nr:TonB-dependent receptor [Acidobacteriota bacterium]
MHNSGSTAIALVLAAALLSPAAASGQDAGSISGTVTDATGLILPGVTVEVRDAAGVGQVTFTGGTGEFSISGLDPGTYEVTFTLAGFEADPQTVEVMAGVTANVEAEMSVGLQERVVVVGTRAQPRSVTESPVPVDVIRTEDFASQGSTDLANQLRTVVPSFNISIQPISDAATIVRPANLRNLAPDHALILVNGKRRHRAAVITWLGNGIADGSQGPDLSVIPSIAIRQAEVLRDGAAAQYGSDAIAGVMNFQLKDAREGGSLEFRTGGFLDANPGTASTCGSGIIGDISHSCNGIGGHGRAMSVAGNVGLPLGSTGFINLSMEYGNANPTNRSVQRNDAQAIIDAGNTNIRNPAQVWGSPLLEDDLKLFGNFGHLFNNGLQFYGHTNYAQRKVTGGFYFRNPHTRGGVFRGPTLEDGRGSLLVGDRVWADTGVEGAGGCPTIPIVDNVPDAAALAAVEADPNCFTLYSRFPGGFTPQFGGDLIDYSLVTGLRGFASNGFTWDASVNIGTSEVDQFIYDTVNASLGYDTPTSFNPGSYRQDDVNLNFDVSYPVNDVVNVAAGTEWRDEKFTIGAGGQPSWEIGPYAAQGFSSGSNGFNGYRADTTAGVWSRSNVAVYGDLEFDDPGGRWTVGTAVRMENFEDFGTTTNGKLSARVGLSDAFSLRAAVSTGFRAPTPGQQNAFNVTTAFIGGQLTNNGVVPATSAVAVARGGGQLQPEKSRNYSAGAVFEQGAFSFTADFFRIDIDDRVALSQEIALSEGEIETLLAEGIPEARNFPVFRFFLNDFSTTTQGVDLIGTLAAGRTTFNAIFNYTDTELKNIESAVIDEFRINTLERGLPNIRWNFSVNHRADRWSLMGRLNYFGAFWDSEDGRNSVGLVGGPMQPWLYPAYSGKALLDLELGIPLSGGVNLALGAENVLNAYPEVNMFGAQTVGNQYGQFSPFGFNGAYYYLRINYGWGGGSL